VSSRKGGDVARGITTPEPDAEIKEHRISQEIKDSTVEECYDTVGARDARVSQLRLCNLASMSYVSHLHRFGYEGDLFAVRWNEPRGEERG
jgi:hypothetical protein